MKSPENEINYGFGDFTISKTPEGIKCQWELQKEKGREPRDFTKEPLTAKENTNLNRRAAGCMRLEALPLLHASASDFSITRPLFEEMDNLLNEDCYTPAFDQLNWWEHVTKEDALQASAHILGAIAPDNTSLISILVAKGLDHHIPQEVMQDFSETNLGQMHGYMYPEKYEKLGIIPSHKWKGIYNWSIQQERQISRTLFKGKTNDKAKFNLLSKQDREKMLLNPDTMENAVIAICLPANPAKGMTMKQAYYLAEAISLHATQNPASNTVKTLGTLLGKHLNPESLRKNPKTYEKLEFIPFPMANEAGFSVDVKQEWDLMFAGFKNYKANTTANDIVGHIHKSSTKDPSLNVTLQQWQGILEKFKWGSSTKNQPLLFQGNMLETSMRYLEKTVKEDILELSKETIQVLTALMEQGKLGKKSTQWLLEEIASGI